MHFLLFFALYLLVSFSFTFYFIFYFFFFFFFSSRRRHTISDRDWSSDVCSSDLVLEHVSYNNYFYFYFKISVFFFYPPFVCKFDRQFFSIHLRIITMSFRCKIGRASCRERV